MRTAAAERSGGGIEQARAELASRLQARRPEIELALMTRVYAIADPKDLDPVYAEGLNAGIGAAIDYSFGFVKLGERHSPPPPPALLAQSRLAARLGVSLDTVLRRYVAGHSLLVDFAVEEAERADLLDNAALKRLLRGQASIFDRLLEAVSEEYAREADARLPSAEQRRTERIERLLAGELLDTSDLAYEFEGHHHLGLIAKGPGASDAVRELGSLLDRRLLSVRSGAAIWAWLGSRRPVEPEDVERILVADWPPQLLLAVGEPDEGLGGWRQTHRQARAALPVALRGREPVVRYADVALLASLLQDDLLTTSLNQLYLAPLEEERDGGEALRGALRAYLAADRNASSAAAMLGISRHTIASRLRVVEERLGRSLRSCAVECEAAMRLRDLQIEPTQADSRIRINQCVGSMAPN